MNSTKTSVKYRARSVEESRALKKFRGSIPDSNGKHYWEINKKESIRMHRLNAEQWGHDWGRYSNDDEDSWRNRRKPRYLPFSVEGGGPITRNWFISSHIGRAIFGRCCLEGREVRRRAPWRPASLHPVVQSIYLYTWYTGWPAWRINPIFERCFLVPLYYTRSKYG